MKQTWYRSMGAMSCALLLALGTACNGAVDSAASQEESVSPNDVQPTQTEVPALSAEEERALQVEAAVEQALAGMTQEEQVAQLFIIEPDALLGMDVPTALTDAWQESYAASPVGGFIYLAKHLDSPQQTAALLEQTQQASLARTGVPAFQCIDEEGGTVARISGTGKFDIPAISNMCDLQTTKQAYETGLQMAAYLSALGFTVDFAPVADVWENEANTVVKYRAFGSDAAHVAEMAVALSDGLLEGGVMSAFKHFPGHGATQGDSHDGYASSPKTLEALWDSELIPFVRGIESEVPFIMVGHISLPAVTGDALPASLSPVLMQNLLRDTMGYEGIILTDALNMGAVAQHFSAQDVGVKALLAGADMILMPQDFGAAYQGVLGALADGTLTQARLTESVKRVLRCKLSASI